MITIIDYGMGNLRSVAKALEAVGAEVRIARTADELGGADKIVLPGVGAFADAMRALRERGMIGPIGDHLAADRPFLGICLGLHLLFEVGEEGGTETPGLGWLRGRVVRFRPSDGGERLPIPHMGWNQVRILREDALLDGIPDRGYFYFLHSFYVVPGTTDDDARLTETPYPDPFCSAIGRGRVWATQFHPEKSQSLGLRVLTNFSNL